MDKIKKDLKLEDFEVEVTEKKDDSVERVKTLREGMGMTQKEFSEYFEVSKRSVEEWERGGRRIPMYLLKLMEYKAKKEKLDKNKEE